jgi:hypothetical protein
LKKNRKNFEAQAPRRLLEMIQEKEVRARELVKELEKLQRKLPRDYGTFVYEGWRGIETAQEQYFTAMKPRQGDYLSLGASRALHIHLDGFFNSFHAERAKRKVPAKLLFDENNLPYGKSKKQYAPVEVRFLPPEIITPSWISTYADTVLIGVAEEEAPMAILIRNRAVAESYRQYFYFMWAQGKEK